MNPEPRHQAEYESRQVEAARRVLVDLGQVLASFRDCLVVVGGWVPDLLISEVEEVHVGSIDVDLALDTQKLNDGRYAELLKLLFDTRRYHPGAKPFQLLTDADLGDGGQPVQVEVEFLAVSCLALRFIQSDSPLPRISSAPHSAVVSNRQNVSPQQRPEIHWRRQPDSTP